MDIPASLTQLEPIKAASYFKASVPRLAAQLTLAIVLATLSAAAPLKAQSVDAQAQLRLAAVFGKDSRTAATETSSPQRQYADVASSRIGAIQNIKGTPICTAVCIRPDLVLTAAHCLAGQPWGRRSIGDIAFRSNTSRRTTPIIDHIAPIEKMSTAAPITAHQDWAVLRISAPICPKIEYETMRASGKTEGTDLTQVFLLGFHRDRNRGTRLVRSDECALDHNTRLRLADLAGRDFATPQSVLFHHCDNASLSSGAPLFRQGPNGPELIAINIGTYVRSRTIVPRQASAARTQTDAIANTAIPLHVIWQQWHRQHSRGALDAPAP